MTNAAIPDMIMSICRLATRQRSGAPGADNAATAGLLPASRLAGACAAGEAAEPDVTSETAARRMDAGIDVGNPASIHVLMLSVPSVRAVLAREVTRVPPRMVS